MRWGLFLRDRCRLGSLRFNCQGPLRRGPCSGLGVEPPYWQGAPGWLGWLDCHPSEQPGLLLEAELQRPFTGLGKSLHQQNSLH